MRVLLVDDHAPIRRSLRQILELKPGFEVVGEGSNGLEAIAGVDEHRPDVVLMDMNMPVMNGVEATRSIKEQHPSVHVLALTAFGEMSLVAAMVEAGAAGYLLKGGSSQELVSALNAVASGHGALDKEVTRSVLDDMADLYKKEQERAEALAELDRMKSEFVSIVSHELLTPLTSIKGGLSTLTRGWNSIDEPVRSGLLDSMTRQCERLQLLIEKILLVSGIRHGELGLKASAFSPAEVVADVAEMVKDGMRGRELIIRPRNALASGDRESVREVVLSLVENALNFTTGKIHAGVSERGDEVLLEVSDEGPGIDEETLGRLLSNPFVQGDSSLTRRVGGLGLSLYIAKHLLEASGGRLEVDTGPERGSTFRIVLPAAKS